MTKSTRWVGSVASLYGSQVLLPLFSPYRAGLLLFGVDGRPTEQIELPLFSPHAPTQAIGAEPVLVQQCKAMVHQYLPEASCGLSQCDLVHCEQQRESTDLCSLHSHSQTACGLRQMLSEMSSSSQCPRNSLSLPELHLSPTGHQADQSPAKLHNLQCSITVITAPLPPPSTDHQADQQHAAPGHLPGHRPLRRQR